MSEDTLPVLHVINGEFYAGAERVQDLLAGRLPDLGYRVDFACLKEGDFAIRRRSTGAGLHLFPMKSRFDIATAASIARLARRGGHRIIHTHTVRTALVGGIAARLAGVSMVHHVHSPAESDTEVAARNARNALVERLALRGATRLICVSSSLERYVLARGARPERIGTVWNGVPMSALMRPERAPGAPLTLGTMALFRPRKGLEVLLEALALLRKQGCEAMLRAVGAFETTAYRDEVLQRAEQLGVSGCVEWTGFAEDIADALRRMHVFVLPSLYGEGTPMVLLEAMAAGLPVVATRVEGVPSVLRDGVDGVLVRPGHVEDLLRALRGLADGGIDGAVLGDSARARQRERFCDLEMARGVAEIYGELLDARGATAPELLPPR